jgi:hypothetical protein
VKKLLQAILYLVTGAVLDLAVTRWYILISARQSLLAALLGGVYTLVTIFVYSRIVVKWDWVLAGAFSVGTGVGVYLAFLF